MWIRCGSVALAASLWASAFAAPSLSTVEDVLYKANGSKFNGVAFVEWRSFQAADLSAIATHSVTVPIVDGILRVRLVPTTNATPAAYYSVRYYSDGRIQFDEIWAVRPSDTVLTLRDVRIPSATTAGQVLPPVQDTEIRESDVVGLLDDLAARPLKGPGFAPFRTVYINEAGELESVLGELTDCVRVDGTAGPCDLLAYSGPGFVDAESPSGSIDGINMVFFLSEVPSPPSSLALYRNGLLQKDGLDDTISDNLIQFGAESIPQTGDILTASYRLADTANPAGAAGGALTGVYPNPWIADGVIANVNISDVAAIAESKLALNFPTHSSTNDPTTDQKAALTGTVGAPSGTNRYVTEQDPRLGGSTGLPPRVLCSSTGASTSSATSTSLGTCTLSAGSLALGDRVEVIFQFSHEGANQGFTYDLRWGGTTVLSRSGLSSEARTNGVARFGVYAQTGTQFDVESWGSGSALAAASGNATDSTLSSIVIDLRGRFSSSTTDTLTLRNYTVIRYPAVAAQ